MSLGGGRACDLASFLQSILYLWASSIDMLIYHNIYAFVYKCVFLCGMCACVYVYLSVFRHVYMCVHLYVGTCVHA